MTGDCDAIPDFVTPTEQCFSLDVGETLEVNLTARSQQGYLCSINDNEATICNELSNLLLSRLLIHKLKRSSWYKQWQSGNERIPVSHLKFNLNLHIKYISIIFLQFLGVFIYFVFQVISYVTIYLFIFSFYVYNFIQVKEYHHHVSCWYDAFSSNLAVNIWPALYVHYYNLDPHTG